MFKFSNRKLLASYRRFYPKGQDKKTAFVAKLPRAARAHHRRFSSAQAAAKVLMRLLMRLYRFNVTQFSFNRQSAI